jgi:hypothetical protein
METRKAVTLHDLLWLLFLYLTMTNSLWYLIPCVFFFPLWLELADAAAAKKEYEKTLNEIGVNEDGTLKEDTE